MCKYIKPDQPVLCFKVKNKNLKNYQLFLYYDLVLHKFLVSKKVAKRAGRVKTMISSPYDLYEGAHM